MVFQATHVTPAEFERFLTLPENAEKIFELIAGEIVEVPSNPYSSKLAARINRHHGAFVDDHDLGHVTGEAGGYMVSGERYAPDVAFISKARQPQLPTEGYNPLPPDFAVEVVSPNDREQLLRIKVVNYLTAGTVVWVVYPETRQVEIYIPGQPVKLAGIGDVLDGEGFLPGFTLAVKDIFKE